MKIVTTVLIIKLLEVTGTVEHSENQQSLPSLFQSCILWFSS